MIVQVVYWPIGLAGGLDLLMALFLFIDVYTKPTETLAEKKKSSGGGLVSSLQAFAGNWWFPWLVATCSGINTFLIVFSGPIAALFVSAVLARPSRKYYAAVVNALGTFIGASALVYLVRLKGTDYLTEAFPQLFAAEVRPYSPLPRP